MTIRTWLAGALITALLISAASISSLPACCPAPPLGKPVVNADQTVILIWDAATQTQHFIRQASFKSDAEEFGFLVPSPNQPELNESGNEAFPFLLKLTEPEKKKAPFSGGGIGCARSAPPGLSLDSAPPIAVKVLEEKLVAGFNATVLEATSATALVDWLQRNGFAFSPEVEAWAKPYVEKGWKITALKVAKSSEGQEKKTVAATALRMSFKTPRPLFPYREPESRNAAVDLGANRRLLRIYFLAEARYQGELTQDVPWTGTVAWAGKVSAEDRTKLLDLLKLPATTGPANWWLTEFEDPWPYRTAPADLHFAQAAKQETLKREPIYVQSAWPVDAMVYALAAALVVPPLWTRFRRRSAP